MVGATVRKMKSGCVAAGSGASPEAPSPAGGGYRRVSWACGGGGGVSCAVGAQKLAPLNARAARKFRVVAGIRRHVVACICDVYISQTPPMWGTAVCLVVYRASSFQRGAPKCAM